MSKRAAFSLVEVMLSVTIAVVAIGVATLGLEGVSTESSLRAAATDLATGFRQAGSQARATGRPVVLRLRRSGWELKIPQRANNSLAFEAIMRGKYRRSVMMSDCDLGPIPTPNAGDTVGMDLWIHPQTDDVVTVTLEAPGNSAVRARIGSVSGLEAIAPLDVTNGARP